MTASGITLVRNEAEHRFPHAEEALALEELRRDALDVLEDGLWEAEWRVLDPDDLTEVELEYMVERGLMTPSFAEKGGNARAFAIYGEDEASLEINGEDHFRLVAFRCGAQLENLWQLISRLDDQLEVHFSYAFHPQFGYLTARPSRSGTGMRAFATLHVPALVLTGRLPQTALELVGNGLGLAPLWSGAGGLVQVSNSGAEGRAEEETIHLMQELAEGIVETERSVRKMLLRENTIQVKDHIGRAIGMAQHARTMCFGEAVNLVSAIEVGRELGLVEVPGMESDSAFELMKKLQPAHIMIEQLGDRAGSLDSPEIDECRARLMREKFAGAFVVD
ncbi:MAG: hypothetical protein N3B14_07165 [Thermoleophilia bacterium]|nr:hypothetical protein [Thermoleophilia bacterium]